MGSISLSQVTREIQRRGGFRELRKQYGTSSVSQIRVLVMEEMARERGQRVNPTLRKSLLNKSRTSEFSVEGASPGPISSQVTRNDSNAAVTVQRQSQPETGSTLIGEYNAQTQQSRLLNPVETQGVLASSGGMSVPLSSNTSSVPDQTVRFAVREPFVLPAGGAGVYSPAPKVNRGDANVGNGETRRTSRQPGSAGTVDNRPYNRDQVLSQETAGAQSKPWVNTVSAYKEYTPWYNVPVQAQRLGTKLEDYSNRPGGNAIIKSGALIGGAALNFASGAAQSVYSVVRYPIETIKGTVKSVAYPRQTVNEIRSTGAQNYANPVSYWSGVAGQFYGPSKIPGIIGKVGGSFKNVYVAAGSKKVPAKTVFSPKVLSGQETMPLAKSIADSKSRFLKTSDMQGAVYADTASPAKISGTTASIGKKAGQGIEDPGIYVTPRGEGSPYFLRLGKDVPTEYSLNPFKDFRARTGVPTVTRFKATGGLGEYPSSVVKQPGYEAVLKYQKEVAAGTGKVFITKNSMIGQGELPITKAQPKGTSEIEAVVPVGQQFKYTPKTTLGRFKGFDEYTNYKGRNIALREAELLKIKESGPTDALISGRRVARESSSVSSLAKNYKSPYRPIAISSSSQSLPPRNLGLPSTLSTSSRSVRRPTSSYTPYISGASSTARSLDTSPASSVASTSTFKSTSSSSLSPSSSIISSSSSSTKSSGSTSSTSGSSFSQLSKITSSPYRSSFPKSSPSTYTTGRSYNSLTTPKYNPPTNKKLPSTDKKKSRKELFDVFIRRFGKEKKVNLKGLELSKAEKLLKFELSSTAAASGRLASTTGRSITAASLSSNKQFRVSKRDPLRLVERSRYRINTPGELRGITYKANRGAFL